MASMRWSSTRLNPCFSGTYSQRIVSRFKGRVELVLILVLVEHTLRDKVVLSGGFLPDVLILVLVEHTLRDPAIYVNLKSVGLNPCFSGTYSQSFSTSPVYTINSCLNPCFSGTYSQS